MFQCITLYSSANTSETVFKCCFCCRLGTGATEHPYNGLKQCVTSQSSAPLESVYEGKGLMHNYV